MKAVILAGGKGTRLSSIATDIPKPMVKVGDMPVLEHQVRLLALYGIKDIIIITGHLSNVIEGYFREGTKWGVNIEYYIENEPLGTVGGLKEIEDKLTEDFIVFYGDVMIEMNLKKFIDFHKSKGSACTLALHPNDHPYDSDLVEIDKEGKITAVHPKPHSPDKYYRNLVNAGAYIMGPEILGFLEKGKKADFGQNIFPKIATGANFYGYNTAEYLKDMGTPERLEQVNKDYGSGKIMNFNNEKKRRAIFLDRDGVINEERGFIYKPEDLHLMPEVPEAIRKINESEYLSIVITNQSVIARNMCTIPELENIHAKMETELGEKHAKLDAIYYCPHHPDKGFAEELAEYKIDCECRKPKPGMLLDAARYFNIDLENSYMIGDTERDILAGKNAGVKTIAVRTGNGLRNATVKADYFFEHLPEAVDFILKYPFEIQADNIVNEYLKNKSKKPFVALIAGNSRAGKTTFSAVLHDKFIQSGAKVLSITLDKWIILKKNRLPHHNVFDRFQMPLIEKDIERILQKKPVRVNGYGAYTMSNAQEDKAESDKELIVLGDEDVVIIEGVVALSSKSLREKADMKVFVTMPEQTRKERLRNFYLWKGLGEEEIAFQYQSRWDDEYKIIMEDERWADVVVK